MQNAILSLLLSAQMLLSAPLSAHPAAPQDLARAPQEQAQAVRLWWGLIDPELSTWFARIPMEEDEEKETILWDWSWRGFLAAIFGQPVEKEDVSDASCV